MVRHVQLGCPTLLLVATCEAALERIGASRTLGDRVCRAPPFEHRQADGAVVVDVGVVHLGLELHLRRLEGVIRREVRLQLEGAALPRGAGLSTWQRRSATRGASAGSFAEPEHAKCKGLQAHVAGDTRLPGEHVVANGPGRDPFRSALRELSQLLQPAPPITQ